MDGQPEKRMAENYEITQAVYIGDREVVMGMDETNAMPYFVPVILKMKSAVLTMTVWCPMTMWKSWRYLQNVSGNSVSRSERNSKKGKCVEGSFQ